VNDLDLKEMRERAAGWLRVHDSEPEITRANALGEGHMALDIMDLTDEVERLREVDLTVLPLTRNSREWNRKRALDMEHERDAYRAMVADLLASAYPHPIEHPTMTKQWARARALLKNGPTPREVET